jgi:hypothetical protein
VALVLCQFTGVALDAMGGTGAMTRMERVKWLAGAVVVVLGLLVWNERANPQPPTDNTGIVFEEA